MKHASTCLFERMKCFLIRGLSNRVNPYLIFYKFRLMIIFYSVMVPFKSTPKILAVTTIYDREHYRLGFGWVLPRNATLDCFLIFIVYELISLIFM